MGKTSRAYLGCGAVVVLGLVATAVLMLNVGSFGRFTSGVIVELQVEDAAGLNTDGDVLVAGVPVGTVRSIRLEQGKAILELKLNAAAELRQDTRARVRMRSLLGEKYVELDPTGSDAPLLTGGERLPPAAPQMDIDEMIAVLGPLIEGVDGSTFTKLASALEQLLAEDPEAFGRMVRNADTMLENGARASGELTDTLARGRRTLAGLDGAVASVKARADQAEAVIDRADLVLVDLQEAAEPLPEAIAHAEAAIQEVRDAVGPMTGAAEDLANLLNNFEDTDLDTVRGLLRDDGVRVHLFGRGKRHAKED